MKIAMVITSYHPIVGGAEKQVAQLASLMRSAGHDVTIITRRWPGLPAKETIDGILVHRVGWGGAKSVAAASFVAGAVVQIRKLAPDVIHCHSLFSPALAASLGKVITSVPFVAKPMCGGEASAIWAKPLGRMRLRAIGRNVDRFVAVSSEIESELKALGVAAEKIRRIPNGVDLHRFRPARDPVERDALRVKLSLPEKGPLFLFAGRIAAQKRLPQLLKEWPRVLAAVPGALLLVAGANRTTSGLNSADGADDSVPAHLQHQPGVKLLGHIADMAPLYRAVDVFVLPSMREGLSNAMLEACASGLPTVAAAIGGAEDLIESDINGVLYQKDRMDHLGNEMIKLGRSPERRVRIGAAAREIVAAHYDIEGTAARLLDLYQELRGERQLPDRAGTNTVPD